MPAAAVIDVLAEVLLIRGAPAFIRSDNGPEFIASAMRQYLTAAAIGTLYIEPGARWENGYVESFNGKLRDELLNGEIFYTLREAKVLIERWRVHYNTVRPHSALGYRPPAPEAVAIPCPAAGYATWPGDSTPPAAGQAKTVRLT